MLRNRLDSPFPMVFAFPPYRRAVKASKKDCHTCRRMLQVTTTRCSIGALHTYMQLHSEAPICCLPPTASMCVRFDNAPLTTVLCGRKFLRALQPGSTQCALEIPYQNVRGSICRTQAIGGVVALTFLSDVAISAINIRAR